MHYCLVLTLVSHSVSHHDDFNFVVTVANWFLPLLNFPFNVDFLILLLSDIVWPLKCAGVPLRNYLLTIIIVLQLTGEHN